jgi:hypothetical protein
MKERLIELLKESSEKVKQYIEKSDKTPTPYEIYEMRANYLIENGVIVPPVMLGQKMWEVVSWDENVRECRVSSLTQKADGTFKIRITNLKSKSVYERVPQHIGDIIFLTKEEAEKKLKERKEDV